MTKNRHRAGSRHGLQVVTLCISTTLVLILLGLVLFTVSTAQNLSSYVKENLVVTLMLRGDMATPEGKQLCKSLRAKRYVSNATYVGKEAALKAGTKDMGIDPSEFVGYNPFTSSIELQLKADYANSDSLRWISKELRRDRRVTDIEFQQDLIDSVNSTLQKVSLVLLVLAALLTVVSFSLISNTVRLSVYSRRFSIHTMKLVGASWGFIRRPFLRNALAQGVIAALLADAVLGAGVYCLYEYEPEVVSVVNWQVLAITGGAVLLFGVVITTFCAYVSVNKFLRMTAGDLYKI